MTHVAVLCPGPSFRSEDIPADAITIGINGVVMVHPCTFWAYGDIKIAPRCFKPINRCVNNFGKLIRDPIHIQNIHAGVLPGPENVEELPNWNGTLSLAARMAVLLGAKEVPHYGMTWAGNDYCYQKQPYENIATLKHYGLRWERERERFEKYKVWFLEHFGVRLFRVEANKSQPEK